MALTAVGRRQGSACVSQFALACARPFQSSPSRLRCEMDSVGPIGGASKPIGGGPFELYVSACAPKCRAKETKKRSPSIFHHSQYQKSNSSRAKPPSSLYRASGSGCPNTFCPTLTTTTTSAQAWCQISSALYQGKSTMTRLTTIRRS